MKKEPIFKGIVDILIPYIPELANEQVYIILKDMKKNYNKVNMQYESLFTVYPHQVIDEKAADILRDTVGIFNKQFKCQLKLGLNKTPNKDGIYLRLSFYDSINNKLIDISQLMKV